jgi:hypothetical protein
MAAGAPLSAHALTVSFDDLATGSNPDATVSGAGLVNFTSSTAGFTIVGGTGFSSGTAASPTLALQGFGLTAIAGAQGILSVTESGLSSQSPLAELFSLTTQSDGVFVTKVEYLINGIVVDTYDNGGSGFTGGDGFGPILSLYDGSYLITSLGINIHISATSGGQLLLTDAQLTAVPIPGAAWLFGSALLGVVAVGRRRMAKQSVA